MLTKRVTWILATPPYGTMDVGKDKQKLKVSQLYRSKIWCEGSDGDTT